MKVYTQTLLAPLVTTLLFLSVFALALGGAERTVAGLPFIEFLAPGLVMMAIAQNAFANTSSSIVIAKVQGNIVDTLMPPFTAAELTLAINLAARPGASSSGSWSAPRSPCFVDMHLHNIWLIVFHGCAASLMLALLGTIGGIWSDKFDHIAAVTNFIVTPLSFSPAPFTRLIGCPKSRSGWCTSTHSFT